MNFLDYTQKLYNGDLMQAKVMTLLSIVLFVTIVLVLRGNSMLFKGAMIPIFAIALLYAAYGAIKMFNHSARIADITELYQTKPKQAIEKETERANKEIAGYERVIKTSWPVIMLLGLALFAFVPYSFVKGIGLGFMVFALFAIIGDLTLQIRLENYIRELQSARLIQL